MVRDFQEVWHSCLRIIKDNVSPISFKTWFEPIIPIRLNENVLTIQVPSPYYYEYLEEQYIDIISKTLRRFIGAGAKLEYIVVMERKTVENTSKTVKYPTQNKPIPENKAVNLPPDPNSIKNPFVIPGLKKLQINSQLNSTHSMANFIEGTCNKLARQAGISVAEKPGETPFNPLFIYGESGLGKTHLAQAIGIEIKERHSDKIVLYVDASKFLYQYTEATRKNEVNDFIHFYQMIDVLIIDDVQEFGGKEKTQNTFFHIFNHLQQNKKQLILTSDKAPSELKGMEKRLLSRFKWGLSAELIVPDYETRVSILRNRNYLDGVELPEDVLLYLAERNFASIRELEGTRISLLGHWTLIREEITLDLAQQTVNRIIKNSKKEISIDFIQKTVGDYFNIETEDMHSSSRKREIVQARQIAMYFSKNLTKNSLQSIGTQIGGRDHATVLHACKTVTNLSETNKKYKSQIDEIKKRLGV